MSIAIVGGLLVAALNTVGAAKMTQTRMGRQTIGKLLAQDLLAEILQQAYEDPALAEGSFGLGADEAATGNRSLYDDVDDYHGWTASPPQEKDGTELSQFDGWLRSVVVEWVAPADLAPVGTDTRAKQITVTVAHNGEQVASLGAVRTAAMTTIDEGE